MSEEKALTGKGLQRGGAEEEPLLRGKERAMEEQAKEGSGRRIGEESGRGMEGDRNENERAAGREGGAPASASARCAPALAFSPVARAHFVTITGRH